MPIQCDRFDLKPYALTIRREPHQINIRQTMISTVDRNVSHTRSSTPPESEVDAMMNGRARTPPGMSGPRTRESPALDTRRRLANDMDMDTARFGVQRNRWAQDGLPRPSAFPARPSGAAAANMYAVPRQVTATVAAPTLMTMQPIIVHVPAQAPALAQVVSTPLCVCAPSRAVERPFTATSVICLIGGGLATYGAYCFMTLARFF